MRGGCVNLGKTGTNCGEEVSLGTGVERRRPGLRGDCGSVLRVHRVG